MLEKGYPERRGYVRVENGLTYFKGLGTEGEFDEIEEP